MIMNNFDLVYKTLKQNGKPMTILEIWFKMRNLGYLENSISENKLMIKTLEDSIFYDLKNNKNTQLVQVRKNPAAFALKDWQISSEQKKSVIRNESLVESSEQNTMNKRAKTPEQKFFNRIYREIKKFKYIGDILVDDAEYEILIQYLKRVVSDFSNLRHRYDDPILAVALVQVGIREYNGSFWSHVSRICGRKLDGIKQGIIGGVFYETLIKYNKIHLEKGEFVNNILMHCFVTKHYADDFFEFIFAYYQYDLDRDLSRHTKEMRSHLIACMKKAEESTRAFRIKKGTSDAATSNELGCKIRIRNILKWIDTYLFEDVLPDKSPNRIAQFFCAWAKSSKRFKIEKSAVTGYGTKGKIRFRTPYINFDRKTEQFYLVLPVQTVPLNDNEESARLSWKVSYNGTVEQFDSETENTVIGCRNIDKEYFPIKPEEIFSKFCIELIKNGNKTIKKFVVKSDSARFFDDEFDYFSGERLYEGSVYAFTHRGEALTSDGVIFCEKYLGLDFYSMELVKGNVVKKPDGKALFVGKDIVEGLSLHNSLYGVSSIYKEKKVPVYNNIPSLLIKVKESLLSGVLLIVNGERYRLDSKKVIAFSSEFDNADYCVIDLSTYINCDGIYEVYVNIPSERHTREYLFAFLQGFEYDFIGAPYIYKTQGKIKIIRKNSVTLQKNENEYLFDINGETKTFDITIDEVELSIDIPLFKWKFNLMDSWHIEAPEELWHKDFPEKIYFQAATNNIFLCSDMISLDEDELQNIKCEYQVETDIYICDTRKIKSWLEVGSAIHNLSIELYGCSFLFLAVVTRSILTHCELKVDEEHDRLIIESRISGFSDCVVDIYFDGEKVADKLQLTYSGAKFKTQTFVGLYELVFFEYDDEDEFDFGNAVYSEFGRKSFTLKPKHDLIGKTIRINYITEKKSTQSIFSATKYTFKNYLTVTLMQQDKNETNIYYGKSKSSDHTLSGLDIQIEFLDKKNFTRALVFFYDEEEETYVDFMYDKYKKQLVITEDLGLSKSEARKHLLEMTPYMYYQINIIK